MAARADERMRRSLEISYKAIRNGVFSFAALILLLAVRLFVVPPEKAESPKLQVACQCQLPTLGPTRPSQIPVRPLPCITDSGNTPTRPHAPTGGRTRCPGNRERGKASVPPNVPACPRRES